MIHDDALKVKEFWNSVNVRWQKIHVVYMTHGVAYTLWLSELS